MEKARIYLCAIVFLSVLSLQVASNVDLDNYFSKKGFNLDRPFLRYAPSQSLTITMGKFPNPFEHVELVFHNDVQLEGAAQQFRVKDIGFIRQVQLNLGQFVPYEIKSSPDTNLFAGQLFVEGFHFKGLSFGVTLLHQVQKKLFHIFTH